MTVRGTPNAAAAPWKAIYAAIVIVPIWISSGGGSSAREISSFVVGGWAGRASADDHTGRFVSCSAATHFKDGTSLLVTTDNDSSWTLGLTNLGWKLPVGRHYQLQLKFDGGTALEVDSTATSGTALELPADLTLLTLLRSGHSLQVVSGSFKKSYDLTGSEDAVSILEKCARDQLADEAKRSQQARADAHAAFAVEGAAYVAGLFIYGASNPVLVAGFVAYQFKGASPSGPTQVATLTPPSSTAPPSALSRTLAAPDRIAHSSNQERPMVSTEIALHEDGGTFVVPVQINGVMTLDFVVDSGASDVIIPDDVAKILRRAGTIKDADALGERTYYLADGSSGVYSTFLIRSLKIGDLELHDIAASIAPEQGSLLLGQSFLTKFKSWSIDNARQVLVLEHK
jgi:clan AA aspartic protease (TIGR02281 family)